MKGLKKQKNQTFFLWFQSKSFVVLIQYSKDLFNFLRQMHLTGGANGMTVSVLWNQKNVRNKKLLYWVFLAGPFHILYHKEKKP